MTAQTSDQVSSLAAGYIKVQGKDFVGMSLREANIAAADIRTMAASCLRQDEAKGLRRLFRKLKGAV